MLLRPDGGLDLLKPLNLLLCPLGRGGFETVARRETASAMMRTTSIMFSGTNGTFSLRHLFMRMVIAAVAENSKFSIRNASLNSGVAQ